MQESRTQGEVDEAKRKLPHACHPCSSYTRVVTVSIVRALVAQDYHAALRDMLGLGAEPTRMYSGKK